jgi:hypothetical protein
MNALLFDTLRLSRTLRDKGRFTSEQAETLAEALGEAVQGDLATKADVGAITTEVSAARADLGAVKVELAGVEMELSAVKADLATVRAELKWSFAETKADIMKWVVVGAIGFQTVLILGALVSLMRVLAK